jgi:5-methylcytosine-specific restriction endonuclease McrA
LAVHKRNDNNVSKARSFNRDTVYPVGRDEAGKRLCRWDQKPVARRRLAYCSDACQIEVDIRTSASSLRHHVRRRDKSMCASCKCKTAKLRRILNHARRSLRELRLSTEGRRFRHEGKAIDALLIRLGFNPKKSLWEADHIVELSSGGDSSLANTQTLCVPCHKVKTRQMHAARKLKRRNDKSPMLEAST